jgi:uncharacterized protein YkwD
LFATAPAAPVGVPESAVLRDINQIRAEHGLAPVQEDARMDQGAEAHSRAMARRHFFGHGAFARRVRRYAGTSTVGEILAYTQDVARRRQVRMVVRAWMRSAEHRTVILTPGFHRAGVGRARSGGTAFFTVDFAA